MVEKLPIVKRKRIEDAIPLVDCSGKQYTSELREDIIRHCLFCAEIQRDVDYEILKGKEKGNEKVPKVWL